MELPPLPDRIRQLKELAQQHNGNEQIPDQALEAIGYARHTDPETNLTRLVPVERLGVMSVQEYVEATTPERRGPPFERLQTNIELSSQYATAFAAPQLNQKIHEDLLLLEADDGLNVIINLPNTEMLQSIYETCEGSFVVQTLAGTMYAEVGHLPTAVMTREADTAGPGDWDGLFYSLGLDNSLERYSEAALEKMWEELERLKSKITDPDVLNRWVQSWFVEFDLLPIAQHDIGGVSRPTREVVVDDPSALSPEQRFMLRLTIFKDKLSDWGFPDVAERLNQDVQGVAGVQELLHAAGRDCAIARQYKAREKALRAHRAGMTDQEDINQFNRDLSALRAESKAALAPLRAMAEYFDLPRTYARAAGQRIKEVQKLLTRSTVTTEALLELDALPDAQKDADPGRFSGDCTKGRPLPFDQNVGAHNVKLYVQGNHKGNAYLLDTTDAEGRKVWHVDAVQLPSFVIDWRTFPARFTAVLAEAAAEAGVDIITINNQAHLVSNYDYIGRAFLGFAGAAGTDKISYDQMQIPESVEALNFDANTEFTTVNFPPVYDNEHYSEFQGLRAQQVVLWSAARASSVRVR